MIRGSTLVAGLLLALVSGTSNAGADAAGDRPSAYDSAFACARREDHSCVVRVLSHPRQAREFELLMAALRALGDHARYERVRRDYCARFGCGEEPEPRGWL